MSKFFYSENSHKQHQPPDSFWRRFLKYRQKKKAQADLNNYSKLRNPYRKEPKQQRKFHLVPIGLGLLFIVWLAIMVYLPFFQISKLSFTGLKTIKQSKIENTVLAELNQRQWLPSANYFLVSTNKITSKLQENFPLQSITITKIFPNELKIAVAEKISSIVYDNSKYYYLLDESGAVMEILGPVGAGSYINQQMTSTTVSSTAISTTTVAIHLPEYQKITPDFGAYPILYDYTAPENINLKQIVLTKEIIATTIEASEELEKQGIGHLKYFVMESQTAGLKAITDKKFQVLLSFFNPVKDQIANAATILRTNRPNEYVDVRFGERVFWK